MASSYGCYCASGSSRKSVGRLCSSSLVSQMANEEPSIVVMVGPLLDADSWLGLKTLFNVVIVVGPNSWPGSNNPFLIAASSETRMGAFQLELDLANSQASGRCFL